jgi:hypothetical protein
MGAIAAHTYATFVEGINWMKRGRRVLLSHTGVVNMAHGSSTARMSVADAQKLYFENI